MKAVPHYWDAHTAYDMKAHLYEYAQKCREAAAEKNDTDWTFFFGAKEAVQRLLFLYRGRSEKLNMTKAQRRAHECHPEAMESCWVCMGSGVHPQTKCGTITLKRIDMLSAQVQRRLAKMKNLPVCPLCGGKVEYGVFLGTEHIAPSCRSCHSRYGRNGFKTLEQAVKFMRGPGKA